MGLRARRRAAAARTAARLPQRSRLPVGRRLRRRARDLSRRCSPADERSCLAPLALLYRHLDADDLEDADDACSPRSRRSSRRPTSLRRSRSWCARRCCWPTSLRRACGALRRQRARQIVSGSTSIAQRRTRRCAPLRAASCRRAPECSASSCGSQARSIACSRCARRRLDQHLHALDVGDAGDIERHRRVDHHALGARRAAVPAPAAASRKRALPSTVFASARSTAQVRERRGNWRSPRSCSWPRGERGVVVPAERLVEQDASDARSAPTSRSSRRCAASRPAAPRGLHQQREQPLGRARKSLLKSDVSG